MSKTLRLLGALTLATATVPFLGVQSALADSTTISASAQGYFNASGIDKPEEAPAAPPNPINSADGVAKDNLAVAAKGGTEDKVSAILFDVGVLEPGTIVTKAILTLPLAEGGDNISLSPAAAKVRVCAAGDTGFGGEDAAAIALAPERLCKVFSAPGKDSPDKKSYVFDITGLAATWVDGANDGLTLTAAEGADSTNFQVVFLNALKSAKLAVESTPPTDLAEAPVTAPDTGVSGAPGGFSGGSGGSVEPPPVDSGSLGSVSTPTLPEPAPAPAAAAPEAPAPQAAAPATVPVSLETLQPTTAFWLGGILLAAVLALLSLIMGDPTVPAANAKPSRLSRALAERQRGTGSARPAFGRAATV